MSEMTVDALAQEIRRIDGNHTLGAGALAESLMRFIDAALQSRAQGEPVYQWRRASAGDDYWTECTEDGYAVFKNDAQEGVYETRVLYTAPPAAAVPEWYSCVPLGERFTCDPVNGGLVQDDDGPWVLRSKVDEALATSAEPSIPVSKVREMLVKAHKGASQSLDAVRTITAELLRVYGENAELRAHIEENYLDVGGVLSEWKKEKARAKRAESELAALRKRIADA